MVRVLMVTGEYPPMPGGVGDYTRCLVDALERRGCRCGVVTAASAAGQQRVIATGRRWGWSLVQRVRRAAQQTHADLVHIQYQAGAFDLHPAPTILPLFVRPWPCVVTFHDTNVPYLFPKAGPLRRWATILLARQSAAVIATTPEDADELATWQPRQLYQVPIGSNIPAPTNISSAAGINLPGQLKGGQRPTIGFFGFLTPDKGIEDLLRALAKLPEPRPILVLIGGSQGATGKTHWAYAAAIEQRLATAPVPLLRTGYLDAEAVAAALAAVDLVVLPFAEGASLRHGTLIAALMAGAAVVTTTPARREWIAPLRDREHCWLVPPRHPEALAHAIQTLLAAPLTRRHLGEAAKQLAVRVFAWETIAERHIAIYQAVLSRSSNHPNGRSCP